MHPLHDPRWHPQPPGIRLPRRPHDGDTGVRRPSSEHEGRPGERNGGVDQLRVRV